MRILAYCVMPNHWHLLLWPREDGDLSRFVQKITARHTQRWHLRHGTTGRGHLYQGRFKSFAVEDDRHLLTLCRYIEANPLRAGLVARAEHWPWSSLNFRPECSALEASGNRGIGAAHLALTPLPVALPDSWVSFVNEVPGIAETAAVRSCASTGTPYGDKSWVSIAAGRLNVRMERRRPGPAPGASKRP